MGSKIFLTGATGYIGGSVLHTLVTNHPEYDITVLLRNPPPDFSTRYPNIKVIKGDYDSFEILASAASSANIVIHNGDSDHEPSIQALITGLLRRSTPSFLIHLSGTGIVSDFRNPTYLGLLNPKLWSDINHIDEITSLPDHALHRRVDKIIQAAASSHPDKLKTAIICPPDIYGLGKGPGRTRSVMIPVFINEIKKLGGKPFYAKEGLNTRSWVHIDDLMFIYLRIVEAAVLGGGNAEWGKCGYYFASTQEVSQVQFAEAVGNVLKMHGVIENPEPVKVELESLWDLVPWKVPGIGTYLFASNSRTKAERAERLFGYKPGAPSLLETLEEDVLAS